MGKRFSSNCIDQLDESEISKEAGRQNGEWFNLRLASENKKLTGLITLTGREGREDTDSQRLSSYPAYAIR